jgi:hypothetical protein
MMIRTNVKCGLEANKREDTAATMNKYLKLDAREYIANKKWLRKVRVNKTTNGVMFGAGLGAYPALRMFPETYNRHYPRYTTEVDHFTSTTKDDCFLST